MSGQVHARGPRNAPSRLVASIIIFCLAVVGLVTISAEPASAVVTTTAVADAAGSNTAVTINGNQIRQGATLAGGTTIGIGTSALLNPGVGAREIRTQYDANTVYQAGTARAPEGWTLSYSIDGGNTWLNSEPTPASDVTDIKASAASVAAGAIDGYSQTFSTETSASIPSSTFSASTGGDGWGVAFYDDFVFNMYHHGYQSRIDCHLRSTGARCLEADGLYPAQITSPSGIDYYSSSRSDLSVDSLTGRLYSLTSPTSGPEVGRPGMLCINVVPVPTFCGFTTLSNRAELDGGGVTWSAALTETTRVANKIYGSSTTASGVELVCFDIDTQAQCANTPVSLFNAGSSSQIEKIGSKIFVKSNATLTCIETSTLETCAGSWPNALNSMTLDTEMIAVHTTALGVPDGICTSYDCFNIAGVSQTWVNPYGLPGYISSDVWFKGTTTLGRYYYGNGSNMFCFDYATEAACAGFVSQGFGYLYQIAVDPENPTCLWTDEDAGRIINMDAYTGDYGCGANPVITLQPSQFAPRYACSTDQGIDQWRFLKISELVGGGTATSIALTVRDALGNPVAGFTNLPIQLNQEIDLTSMNIALSGSRPTFSFAFTDITGSITSATVAVEYKGKGPELCSTAVLSSPVGNTTAVINSYFTDSVGAGSSYQSARSFVISSATVNSNLYLTVPSEPRNLVGSGLNTNAILTFRAPIDNGGLDLGDYQISQDGGLTWNVIDDLADNGDGTFSVSVANLTPGDTYPMRIAATNSIGRGNAASLSLTAQVVDFRNIPDTQQNAGPIYLATQVSAGLPYTYTASPAGVCTVAGNAVTLVAVGTCTLVQNQAGDSTRIATTANASFNVLANPVVVTPPSAPITLVVTPGSTQVSLTWATPTNLGNGAITDYAIQYKVGTSWVPFIDGISTNTFAVVTGLTNGTTYSFKVAAINSAGQGLFGASVNGTPATVPDAPIELAAVKTDASADLTWTAPSSNGGSAITDYIVEYKLSDESAWTEFADGVQTSTGATVTGLLAGSTYDFQVTAENVVGTGASVSTVTLSVTSGNASISLAWAANTDGATIVNHIVQYRLLAAVNWTSVDSQSTSRTANLINLINGLDYEVRVARLIDGDVVSSYTSTVRSKPLSPPGAPVLTATAGISQVTLSWTVPIANGSAIVDFTLRYRISGVANWTSLTDGISTNTSAVVIGLTNGSQYDFQAAAVNAAGTGAFSTAAVATPRKTPGPISDLTLVANAGTLQVSWVAPTDNGGAPVTDYEVQYRDISSTVWRTLVHPVTTSTSHSIANLEGLTRYSVRIAAVNEAGIGTFGASGSEITGEAISNSGVTATTGTIPLIDPMKMVMKTIMQNAREKVAFEFLRVMDVDKVIIDNQEIPFAMVAGVLTITDPGLSPGAKEVRISGPWGTVTLPNQIMVLRASAATPFVGVKALNVSNFAAGSSVLSPKLKVLIKKIVAKNATKTSMVCAGYTSGPSVLGVDPELASARAKAVCSYAKSLNPKLTFATRGFNTLVNNATARKVLVSFSK